MTIIQLEYLLAVANYGSFSLAAKKCFVTQPSLSMQVKNLEEELGIILLDRSKKPVIPTDIGAVVLDRARDTIKAFYLIKETVLDIQGEISGTLRLGIIPTIAPYLLHRFLPVFAQNYPNVDLQVREMTTPNIIYSLNHDMLDVAIMAGGTSPDEIIEEELFNDRFYAYVSENHPFYERSNIRIEDIDPKRLLLLSEGNCMRDQVLELCQAQKNTPKNYTFESGSLESLMRIVDHTANMTIIPEMALPYIPLQRRGCVKSLSKDATHRKITIALRRTYIKRSLVNKLKETIIRTSKEHNDHIF